MLLREKIRGSFRISAGAPPAADCEDCPQAQDSTRSAARGPLAARDCPVQCAGTRSLCTSLLAAPMFQEEIRLPQVRYRLQGGVPLDGVDEALVEEAGSRRSRWKSRSGLGRAAAWLLRHGRAEKAEGRLLHRSRRGDGCIALSPPRRASSTHAPVRTAVCPALALHSGLELIPPECHASFRLIALQRHIQGRDRRCELHLGC